MADQVIHTLNARDNILPELLLEHFYLSSVQMMHEIQAWRRDIGDILKSKGVDYNDLKYALVPSPDRVEIALFFDSTVVGDSWYGFPIFERLIPLLPKDGTFSVLVGDLLSSADQDDLYKTFSREVTLARDLTWRHSTQFFAVYINNLSDKMAVDLVEGLLDYEPFVGFADMTYSSRMKLYLSTMLVNSFVKHKQIILQEHEPDRSNSEDINMSSYPFEENGYICKSIADPLFGLMLSYKIERFYLPDRERDAEISLNSVSPNPADISKLELVIEDKKLKYLQEKKGASLERAGLSKYGLDELRQKISEKLASSYIYSMTFVEKHDTTKFNIILEFETDEGKRSRHIAALEYIADRNVLRLITFF